MKLADRGLPPWRALPAGTPFMGILAVLTVAVALVVPTSGAFLLTTAAIYAILALSLLPILGGVGMLSMCQLTFAAVGAATMGALAPRIPFLLAVLIAGLAAVPLGLLVGAISLRLRGVSFAAASLGLAVAAQVVISHVPLPGMQSGESVTVPEPLSSTRGYLFFALASLAVVSLIVWQVTRSRVGREWAITRFSERGAAAAGVSVPRAKLLAAGIGSAIAGFGGALMVGQYGFITADAVAPVNGLVLLVVALVAGSSRISGAWLAGLLFIVVPWLLTEVGLPADVAVMLFGIAAVQVLASGGHGIAGQIAALLTRRRRTAEPPVVDPSLLDLVPPRPAGREQSDLVIDRLTVDYGAVRAVDEVTMRVASGAVTGLIGPNGAGKSSVIDAVSGFVGRYAGTVGIGDRALDRLSARGRARAGLRRTFQQSRVPLELTVTEYLRLCAGSADAVDVAELGELGSIRLGELDVASRRVVEVAGALWSGAEVVLLDEPAAGLAPAGSLALGEAVARAARRLQIGVLIVEHDVDLVRSACDRVYVLDFGRILADGVPDAVLTRPDVVAAYLGSDQDDD